jgi:hypothetical protein
MNMEQLNISKSFEKGEGKRENNGGDNQTGAHYTHLLKSHNEPLC